MSNHLNEVKQLAKQNTIRGFAIAVIGHLLLFVLYFAVAAIAREKDKQPFVKRPPTLTEIISPPSIKDKAIESPVTYVIPQEINKPVFGIPIPVPNIDDINKTLPDINALLTVGKIGDTATGRIVGEIGSTNTSQVEIPRESPKKADPKPEDYVDHTEDPMPIQNIQHLIVYPEVAKRSGIEGKVVASVLINVNGTVEKVMIEKSDNDIFNASAIDALSKARFTPARNDRTAVAIWWTIPISFKLSR